MLSDENISDLAAAWRAWHKALQSDSGDAEFTAAWKLATEVEVALRNLGVDTESED